MSHLRVYIHECINYKLSICRARNPWLSFSIECLIENQATKRWEAAIQLLSFRTYSNSWKGRLGRLVEGGGSLPDNWPNLLTQYYLRIYISCAHSAFKSSVNLQTGFNFKSLFLNFLLIMGSRKWKGDIILPPTFPSPHPILAALPQSVWKRMSDNCWCWSDLLWCQPDRFYRWDSLLPPLTCADERPRITSLFCDAIRSRKGGNLMRFSQSIPDPVMQKFFVTERKPIYWRLWLHRPLLMKLMTFLYVSEDNQFWVIYKKRLSVGARGHDR